VLIYSDAMIAARPGLSQARTGRPAVTLCGQVHLYPSSPGL
jgi:hypothetical protein